MNTTLATSAAANVNASATAPAGWYRIESATWRAYRMGSCFRLVSLIGAGKTGARCVEFTVNVPWQCSDKDAALDGLAPSIAFCVESDLPVASVRSLLADVTLAGYTLTEETRRGVDVHKLPEIRVESELVSGTFNEVECRGTISFMVTPKNSDCPAFRQDEHFSTRNRKDAAKVYAWVKDHKAAFVAMAYVSQFRTAMAAIGVHLD